MEAHALLLFTATVLPLICTPGPDMLFVASQSISAGAFAGLRSTFGVCLGYIVHSGLVVFGVAALVAASPPLFEALRWIGITYLVFLAYKLIRSALIRGRLTLSGEATTGQVRRGFLTAFLNPKGMMIYFAILPQFMDQHSNIALQATILSAVFIFWCGVVYTILSLVIGQIAARGAFDDRRRRLVEGSAGGLLIVAAGLMAAK